MSYAELHCLSNFSFLRGASHPAELVRRAAQLGYRALAITDECSLAGAVRAYEAVRELPAELPLQLIVGAEFRTRDGLHLVLLAPTPAAYAQLCTLITRARRRAPKGQYHLQQADLYQDARLAYHVRALCEDGLMMLVETRATRGSLESFYRLTARGELARKVLGSTARDLRGTAEQH